MVVDELNAFDDFLMIKLNIRLGTGEAPPKRLTK
jgi:hypothetical protein